MQRNPRQNQQAGAGKDYLARFADCTEIDRSLAAVRQRTHCSCSIRLARQENVHVAQRMSFFADPYETCADVVADVGSAVGPQIIDLAVGEVVFERPISVREGAIAASDLKRTDTPATGSAQ